MQARFNQLANATARAAGRPQAFVLCCVIVAVWGLSGPVFRYSDTWQLVINTGTTIVTFLMVFLIQNTQNRDATAVQTKLDELIRATRARNTFIGIEHLTDDDLDRLRASLEALVVSRGDTEAVPHLRRSFGHVRAVRAERQAHGRAHHATTEPAGAGAGATDEPPGP
jgi:low affinity Fe/Cu permease